LSHPTGRPLFRKCAASLRALPLLCLCIVLSANAAQAQELKRGASRYSMPAGSMPAWTVPVLRLVSSNYVEPTTGIVISDTGLVLVPEDFASMGDEIIVLDGGTDIIRNGRAARIERKFSADGLQVLFVEGLKRRGVILGAADPEAGSEIVLTAFPPAEQIAKGEPPLSVAATVERLATTGQPSISAETKLPNVTGGLVDTCGNLVGISLADDIQSMEPSPATRYQWRDRLLQVFDELKISPTIIDCTGTASIKTENPEEEETQPEALLPTEPEPRQTEIVQEPEPEDETPGDLVGEDETGSDELPENQEEEQPVIILPPIETDNIVPGEPEETTAPRKWAWLLAALIFFGLGLLLHRIRQSRQSGSGSVTETERTEATSLPDKEEESEPSQQLPGSLLLIRGILPDGTSFEDSFPVSERAINVTIGRGDADLRIDSPAVSRRHANLNGTSVELTVSDLGSSNGTSVNGVPCLEGEIMFIAPGDTLVLGNAKCTLEIRPRDAQGSGQN